MTFQRFSLMIVDEFHVHPDAIAGAAHRLESIMRGAVILLLGILSGLEKEKISNWYRHLLPADAPVNTGMEFNSAMRNSAAQDKKKVQDACKTHLKARRRFERAINKNENTKEEFKELQDADVELTKLLGKIMIRRLKKCFCLLGWPCGAVCDTDRLRCSSSGEVINGVDCLGRSFSGDVLFEVMGPLMTRRQPTYAALITAVSCSLFGPWRCANNA